MINQPPIIREVGPRDGLQNETIQLAPTVRAELINRLLQTGITEIEAASFVHPQWVPSMAGAEEVMSLVNNLPGRTLSGLILNQRGFERAIESAVDKINYSFPVTESFAQRNQNTTVEEAIALGQKLIRLAREQKIPITITLSCAFGCPFEGVVGVSQVLVVAEQLLSNSPDEIVIADTIGVGVPTQVITLVRELRRLGAVVGAHFHDTRGTGLANALAALEAGATSLDASIGGAGGCPFAPGATGNIATEDLLYLLRGIGIKTGIELQSLLQVTNWLEEQLGHPLPSRVARAGDFPKV